MIIFLQNYCLFNFFYNSLKKLIKITNYFSKITFEKIAQNLKFLNKKELAQEKEKLITWWL
jgi:hypothetical protein